MMDKTRITEWLKCFYKNRQWKPNLTFLAEHVVSECNIKTNSDFQAAKEDGSLEEAVSSFYGLMSNGLDEVEKSRQEV